MMPMHSMHTMQSRASMMKKRQRVAPSGPWVDGDVEGLVHVEATEHLDDRDISRVRDQITRLETGTHSASGRKLTMEPGAAYAAHKAGFIDHAHMDNVARTQIRDMLYYAIFVAVLTFALQFNRNDQQIFHFSNNIEEHIVRAELEPAAAPNVEKTYNDLATPEEWYQYILGPVMESVYGADTYDGDATFPVAAQNSSSSGAYNLTTYGSALNQRGTLIGHAYVLGGLRLGQVRHMEPQVTCPTPPSFEGTDGWTCFAEEGDGAIPSSQRSFGYPQHITGLTWWDEENDANEPGTLSPKTSLTYANPTVYTVLPHPGHPSAAAKAKAKIEELRDNKFVDLRTRALVLDMNFYSPRLDYTVVARLSAELPAVGGLNPLPKMVAVRLYRDYLPGDIFRTIAEVIVLLLVVRYTWLEIKDIRRHGFITHMKVLGNIAHILNLTLFYVSAIYRIASLFVLPTDVHVSSDAFINFRQAADMLKLSSDINAFNAFLTWIKVFKYLEFVPKLKILLGTLSNASGKVSGFAFITAVVLFGSSQAFMLAFGTQIGSFKNLTASFFSLTRMLLGDYDFEGLRTANPFMGPLMFFCFTMLAVFVLLNMFIAIISDAFTETKTELEQMEDVGVDTIGKAVVRVVFNDGVYRIPCLGKHIKRAFEEAEKRLAKMANNLGVMDLLAMADTNHDGELTAEEVAMRLDTDGNGTITVAEFVRSLVDVGTEPDAAQVIAEMVDTNDDGQITTQELHGLLEAQTTQAAQVTEAMGRRGKLDPLSHRGSGTGSMHAMAGAVDGAVAADTGVKLTPVMIASVARALAHAKVKLAVQKRGHTAVLSALAGRGAVSKNEAQQQFHHLSVAFEAQNQAILALDNKLDSLMMSIQGMSSRHLDAK